MNDNDRQKIEAILTKAGGVKMPAELDKISTQLSTVPEAKAIVLQLMTSGCFLKEGYRLLTAMKALDMVSPLTDLLDHAQPKVRTYAMYTLMGLDYAPKSRQLGQAVYHWLQTIAHPPQEAQDCLKITKAVQTLLVTDLGQDELLKEDIANRLQEILFFIPPGAYDEMFWPKTWLTASRYLRKLNQVEKLKEVAVSPKRSYLSTVGAIALASNGFVDENVRGWLHQSRDHYLLEQNEQEELDKILYQLRSEKRR